MNASLEYLLRDMSESRKIKFLVHIVRARKVFGQIGSLEIPNVRNMRKMCVHRALNMQAQDCCQTINETFANGMIL